MSSPPDIILGIPGQWPTRTEIVQSIAGKSNGYLFAGQILLDMAANQGYVLEIAPHDPRMKDSFTVAGTGRIPDVVLSEIGEHTYVLYLIGPGGSADAVRAIMRAACGLLRAGGLAVKIESAGLAHPADDWIRFTEQSDPFHIHRAFVVQLMNSTGLTTCGMHNFGLRDAIIDETDCEREEASRLLLQFQRYMIGKNPKLVHGHTFSTTPEAPWYRMLAEECTTYPAGDTFHNPYGMWRLVRVVR